MENILCEALAAAGELTSAGLSARRFHRISPTVGQPFFAEMGEATSAIVKAMGHSSRGHRFAAEVGRRFGLETAYGDTGKDDSDAHFAGGFNGG